jgi:hypothetical protein
MKIIYTSLIIDIVNLLLLLQALRVLCCRLVCDTVQSCVTFLVNRLHNPN